MISAERPLSEFERRLRDAIGTALVVRESLGPQTLVTIALGRGLRDGLYAALLESAAHRTDTIQETVYGVPVEVLEDSDDVIEVRTSRRF